MRYRNATPILLAITLLSGCAGKHIEPIKVAPAKVDQLALPVPPLSLTTPIARPKGGYLSTLPQPPHKLLTKP
jgi:hypothetical protein